MRTGLRPALWALVGIASLLTASCSSGGGEAVPTAEEKKQPQPRLVPPTEVTATPKALDASLTWSPDPDGLDAERFIVFRNGIKLVDLGGNATTFLDGDAKPGKTYTYVVRSERDGKRSEGASVTLKIKRPPLAAARLDGLFDVRSKLESSSGFSRVSSTASYGWRFNPKCRTGPCKVVWNDFQLEARAPLERKGAVYSGTYRGGFNVHCGSTETASFVELTLRVTRARKMNGEWWATKVAGTLETSDSPQLGCTASHKTESLIGSFVG